MKIEPKQQAAEAKASMLTHFDKLKESVNSHKDAHSQTQRPPTLSFDI